MRILGIDGREIENPDFRLGYLKPERRFVTHHPAIAAVTEKFHYKEIASYPNGGKDLTKVVDVPGIPAADAWDEYEDILRYVPYTSEELAEREASRKPSPEERITVLEEALEMILSGVTE